MTDKLKNGLILFLFLTIGILLIMRSCNQPIKQEVQQIGKADTTTVIQIIHDTVKFIPKEIIKYITIEKTVKETILDTSGLFLHTTINVYQDSLIDSNLRIINRQTVKGEILKHKIEYELFVPKIVELKIITTRTIKDSIAIYRPYCYDFSGGLKLGGSTNQFIMAPYLECRYKTTYINGSYDLVNKTYNLGLGIHFFSIK